MAKKESEKNKAAVELGRRGGLARARLSKERLSKIGKQGSDARWGPSPEPESPDALLCSYCGKPGCELHAFASQVTREVYEQRARRE